LARDRGETAVTDLRLYNEIFQRHYIQAFNEFCSHHGFELLVAPMEGKELDVSKYVRKQILRREALNLFILQKPHVVTHEERCFIITFLSEIEIRIDEFTVAELAEFANTVLVGQRSALARLKVWHRTRRLRRMLKAARLVA
jgi:hypothetical protein